MSYISHTWKNADLITAERLNAIEQGVAEMSSGYTPHTWQNNEQITAEKMNHIENGIKNGSNGEFSIAEVTIIPIIEGGVEPTSVSVSCGFDDENFGFVAWDYLSSSPWIANIVLYNGVSYINDVYADVYSNQYGRHGNVPIVSGDISFDYETGQITVSGEGTLTIELTESSSPSSS